MAKAASNIRSIYDRPESLERAAQNAFRTGQHRLYTFESAANAVASIIDGALHSVYFVQTKYTDEDGHTFPLLAHASVADMLERFLTMPDRVLYLMMGRKLMTFYGDHGPVVSLFRRPFTIKSAPSQCSTEHPAIDFIVADSIAWLVRDPAKDPDTQVSLVGFRDAHVAYRLIDLYHRLRPDYYVATRNPF
jgi:hypothetical protein